MTGEELLVKRAKSGDDRAFSEIVRTYQGSVYNTALYIAENRDDALDISQEVFLKLWRTLKNFRGESSLKTWIAKITRTCAIDYVRARNQKTTVPLVYEGDEEIPIEIPDEDVSSSPQKSYEREETANEVRRAVNSLPPPIKEAILLREFQGLSYAEIADTMGISEGTVKSRISRGREQIKKILNDRNFF